MPARILVLLLALAGCFGPGPARDDGGDAAPPTDPAADGRAFGDARVIARAPDLWHIEGIAYLEGRVFSGTAFGASGDPLPINNLGQPSRVFVWDRESGELLDTLLVEGEDTMRPHGLIGMTFDARGRLYTLTSQVGLLRWTERDGGWTQEKLASLPDIPPCLLGGEPCSPTLRDEPPIGNDLTWGPDGALYVSDSFQATIWRIAPDGAVEPWFQSEALDRKFGANGIRISPDGSRLAVAVTGPDSIALGPVDRPSVVLSIPFPDPSAGEVETIYSLPNGEYADGIAYGEAGALFVLSNSGNAIHILPPDGGAPIILTNDDLPDDAQMDFPASMAFTGDGAIVVANYAFFDGTANAEGRNVLEIEVDDRGHLVPAPSDFMDAR